MERTDIQIAKELLNKEDIVITMVKNGEVLFSSNKKGIRPFFEALEKFPRDVFSRCSIADRVIGKAALMLAAYLGAKDIYTPLASQHALSSALSLKLHLNAQITVPFIINRTGDGMCPMEKTVLNINDPEKAFDALKNKLQEMMN